MNITHLGEATYPSPIKRTVNNNLRVPEHIVHDINSPANSGLQFELAGPREKIFFDPKETRAGIVTCGGLCPGLNDVIRSLYLELKYAVHAAMAGKTGLVIGNIHDKFIYVPIELLTSQNKRVDIDGPGWSAVLSATGQPERFE